VTAKSIYGDENGFCFKLMHVVLLNFCRILKKNYIAVSTKKDHVTLKTRVMMLKIWRCNHRNKIN